MNAETAGGSRSVDQALSTAPIQEWREALGQEREAHVVQRRDQGCSEVRIQAA